LEKIALCLPYLTTLKKLKIDFKYLFMLINFLCFSDSSMNDTVLISFSEGLKHLKSLLSFELNLRQYEKKKLFNDFLARCGLILHQGLDSLMKHLIYLDSLENLSLYFPE